MKVKRDITEDILCTPDIDGHLKDLDRMMRSYDGVMFHKTYNNTDKKDKKKKRKRKNNEKKGRR